MGNAHSTWFLIRVEPDSSRDADFPLVMSPELLWSLDQTNGRGRDDHRWPPPAQIRTCAFTHTALTEDEWRRSAYRDKDAEHGVVESTDLAAG